ncbi:suppressor of rasval19 [Coemansia guatemalensis]|uniref:Adenylyl cyclase-associated protein n=1 Tax=Coemansia guatemalensis TaxID=2761395 RepID=A0A9W8LS78_9FUNG|nr:suppressor of rasval19 [Coemansia guatemalensis]
MTSSSDLQSLLKRIEKATTRLEELSAKRTEQKPSDNSAGASAPSASDNLSEAAGADNKAVCEYEALLKPLVDAYVERSDKIGGAVSEQAHIVERLFSAQQNFIRIAGQTVKPSAAQLPSLLGPQQETIQQVIEIKDGNRASEYFDNLSTVAEGISAFGWVAVDQVPVPYITDMKESAEFYSNRVLKKWREKDSNQTEWVKAFLSILRELAAYVKEFHTTGLVWNPSGGPVEKAAQALQEDMQPAAASAPTGGAPPPPPPPPPPLPSADELERLGSTANATSGAGDAPNHGALFASINQGSDITRGLRKVEKDQMTHKNPSLRASGTVQGGSDGTSATPPKGGSAPTKVNRPPKMELRGDKWVVENYGTEHVTIEATKTKQTVYMYNCKGTTLDIKNKLNSVAIDSCQKCGVVFDALVSQFEIVNCKSVQIQARETVPSILIDRTDGAHIFLSEAARDQTQITTAKASEVNISFPYETKSAEDDNYIEQPIPEQIQTMIRDGKLVTTILEHAG